MRVAVISDIHGNLPALEAALADIDRESPNEIVVGGDVAAGPMPVETLVRLTRLEHARFVMGNADRELISPHDQPPGAGEGPGAVWAARSVWAARQLSRAHRDFLAGFQKQVVLSVDGLGETLFCHGSPRSDEEILTSATTEQRAREVFAGVEQPTVVCGHTHVQFDRVVAGVRLIKPGSIGMPYQGEPAAYWALLGPSVELRRTAYDLDAAAAFFRRSGYPEIEDFLQTILLNPPSAEWATEFFEKAAGERGPGG